MSLKREVVRDVRPVGERAWIKCDGCGARGPVAESRYGFDNGETCEPHARPARAKGWAYVIEIGDPGPWALERRSVDLCAKCFGFRVDDALDRAEESTP